MFNINNLNTRTLLVAFIAQTLIIFVIVLTFIFVPEKFRLMFLSQEKISPKVYIPVLIAFSFFTHFVFMLVAKICENQ